MAELQVLPLGTVHKPKVGFFRGELDTWLDAQLDGVAGDRLRAPDVAYFQFLNRSAVEALVADYRRGHSEEALGSCSQSSCSSLG